MPTLAGMVAASSGRFVPPLTMARTGQGLSIGQFKIMESNYAQYNYTLAGASAATRSNNIVTITPTTGTATVQAVAPKGIMTSAVVNIGRAAYTYHDSYHHSPVCASNWSKGQCAAWGPRNNHYNGSPLNPGPAHYTNSEGEWWRIW